MTLSRTGLATGALVAALAAGSAPAADAAVKRYRAVLNDISNFGAVGQADLFYDTVANTLKIDVSARNLAPDMLHVQHIHGTFDADGNPSNAASPTLANDTDGDGVVELLEGLPLYGGILLSIFDETKTDDPFMGFPSAPGGAFDFSYTYDLATTAALTSGISAADLFPLDFREIVVHGSFLSPGIGGVGNEVPGENGFIPGGYSAFVPVLAGEISTIPLPAAVWGLVAALASLGGLRSFRSRKA